jgi:hypothetical protein
MERTKLLLVAGGIGLAYLLLKGSSDTEKANPIPAGYGRLHVGVSGFNPLPVIQVQIGVLYDVVFDGYGNIISSKEQASGYASSDGTPFTVDIPANYNYVVVFDATAGGGAYYIPSSLYVMVEDGQERWVVGNYMGVVI